MTCSYPISLSLLQLFYTKIIAKAVKTISLDLIQYLYSIVLAYWARDDGAATNKLSASYLHTKCFSFNASYLLAALFHYQFGLNCTNSNSQITACKLYYK